MVDRKQIRVVIIGAGPAGLTAAYELTKYGLSPAVLEQNDIVGGLARTENFMGYFFDMGGHRFFTKSKQASEMWHEILGEDFLLRPRLSRIYYRNKFFYYPLRHFNALFGLGIFQAILIVLSFIRWQIFPYKREDTFEQWITNRFGKRLFEIFFRTYTEKVWGIPCSELKAEWAAQRIKDLSLKTALLNKLIKPQQTIKSLIEEFHYPRLGPGMLWNAVKQEIERRNGVIYLNSEVTRIRLQGNCVTSVEISQNGGGTQVFSGTDFISSMPISEFVKRLDTVPPEVRQAADKLTYRDFITVGLIINRPNLFPDNWIYIHSPEVRVGRIQNFKNWSTDMVPDPSKTSLGLEYYCTEGDEFWNMTDADLIDLAKKEVEKIGLAKAVDVEAGTVFRVPRAYPIYGSDYRDYLRIIREYVESLENFQTIGRGGLHRYNNQDHSMITGMLAARNIAFEEKNNIWSVNTDLEYHEEVRLDEEKSDTDILILKGGESVGPRLALLGQFFIGFQVTVVGSLIGFLYGFITGFGTGYLVAWLYNWCANFRERKRA